jgi:hypothetical protein
MVVIFIARLIMSPFDLESRSDFNEISNLILIINVVILAPPLETLVFQGLSCMIAYSLKLKPAVQMAVMIIPFALVHFLISISTGMRAGLILGFYLAYVYSVRRRHSFKSAFWTTTAFHALNNAVFVSLSLIFDPPSVT